MKRRHRFVLIAVALAVTAGAAAAGPAAASAGRTAAAPGADPAAVATAFLRARAAAVTAGDPASIMAGWVAAGARLLGRERAVARGTVLHAARLGHIVDSVDTAVTVSDVAVTGDTATVTAHVITTQMWHTPALQSDTEASGVDHTVTLVRGARGWRVSDDSYADVLVPAYLEDAGAQGEAQSAARRLEKTSKAAAPEAPEARIRRTDVSTPGRTYSDIIYYQRDSAAAYADRYCLSYNPTYVRFGADCANFVSQGARAGSMPVNAGTWNTGWWYQNKNTSSPSDDTYSWSWINVFKQLGFWNGLRTDWVSSISSLGKGDMVYYDWTADGVWDHVAIVVGTNSAGQKVVDAHTTDYYRTHWKMGYSSTQYRFARVRPYWVV
jgi:cell wall-associated NlpC family hydrolase